MRSASVLSSRTIILWLDGGVYAVSLYVDGYHTISSALASLALTPSDPSAEHEVLDLPMQRREGCDPRYRCADHLAFIAGYALPPFISTPSFHAPSLVP